MIALIMAAAIAANNHSAGVAAFRARFHELTKQLISDIPDSWFASIDAFA